MMHESRSTNGFEMTGGALLTGRFMPLKAQRAHLKQSELVFNYNRMLHRKHLVQAETKLIPPAYQTGSDT